MLHEPRKHLRKLPIKSAGVDLGRGRPNDLGAAAVAIAARAIAVRAPAILKDAGAVQKVMYQRIDSNHAFAGLEPMRRPSEAPSNSPERVMVRILSETP